MQVISRVINLQKKKKAAFYGRIPTKLSVMCIYMLSWKKKLLFKKIMNETESFKGRILASFHWNGCLAKVMAVSS